LGQKKKPKVTREEDRVDHGANEPEQPSKEGSRGFNAGITYRNWRKPQFVYNERLKNENGKKERGGEEWPFARRNTRNSVKRDLTRRRDQTSGSNFITMRGKTIESI